MQQYFPCHRCGAHNLVGAASCSHCHQQLFYNCPHCQGWVDNRYSHCPQCSGVLKWPAPGGAHHAYGQTWYVPQGNYIEEKKGNPLPAILVSLFIIGVIALIFVNPGNSGAAKSDITASSANSLQTAKTSMSPSAGQPQITVSSVAGPPSSSTPPSTQAASGDSSSYLPASVTLTTTAGDTVEIEISPATSTSGTGYTPKSSAYLQQLYPTWGHCTKGSCQAYVQQ